jgi:hypothetical protein
VTVPPHASFSFSSRQADLLFSSDLDSLNFQELPPETLVARRRPGTSARLGVRDERDRDVSDEFLSFDGNGIRLRSPVMPSMLTTTEPVIRQDCLCYFMERS